MLYQASPPRPGLSQDGLVNATLHLSLTWLN